MNESWRDEAICQQTDPTLFHPEPGGDTTLAKRTCMGCPARRECLDYALTTEQLWGVWGGKDQTELRRLIRAQRKATA